MLRSGEVACATAQDSLGTETFKRVPSHVVMNVPLRWNHGWRQFQLDLGVPTVCFTFFTVGVDAKRTLQIVQSDVFAENTRFFLFVKIHVNGTLTVRAGCRC